MKTYSTSNDTCPGANCYYGTDNATIGGTLPASYSNDYTKVGKTEFLAHLLDSTTGKISRSFACGTQPIDENQKEYFCIEGKDVSKFSDNLDIVNNIYPNSNCGPHQVNGVETGNTWCASASQYSYSNALIGPDGRVQTVSGFYFCQVNQDGSSECHSV